MLLNPGDSLDPSLGQLPIELDGDALGNTQPPPLLRYPDPLYEASFI
jgi:hypothetical protein